MSIKSLVFACCPPFLRKKLQGIESSPLAYRFAKGTFWSLAGTLIARGLGLISSILVARMLGKTGFGELGIIQNTVSMFGTFAGFGLGLTATKFIAEHKVKNPTRAGKIRGISSAFAWITSSLTAMVLYIIAPWLAEHTLAAPQITESLRIGTIFLFLSSINGAQTGALAGFEAFKTSARINIWSGLANFPFMVGGVYVAGLNGALWGMVLATAINWLMNHIAIKRECLKANIPYTYKGCWQEKNVLWKFSFPAFLGGIMTGPIMWAASAILVNQVDGYAEMGVYNAVLRIKQVPEMVLGVVMMPILPILSELYANKSSADYSKTLKYALGLSILITVPFSLIQMASPDLTLWPYGKGFKGNDAVVQWLMAQTIFIGCFNPVGYIISSINKMWLGFVFNIVWGLTYLGFAYLIIPIYGAAGLAAAFTIAYILLAIIYLVLFLKIKTKFELNVPIFKILMLVIILFLACFIGSFSEVLILRILMGCLTTALLLIYLTRWKFLKK